MHGPERPPEPIQKTDEEMEEEEDAEADKWDKWEEQRRNKRAELKEQLGKTDVHRELDEWVMENMPDELRNNTSKRRKLALRKAKQSLNKKPKKDNT